MSTSRRALATALEAHCAALGACRRCGHGDAVLPVLSIARTPKAMLVGQAPGQMEAVDRKPFSGRAGKTLFKWLEQAGIDEATAREKIYISAITRCYPGPSPSGRGDRVPSPREQQECSEWLDGELRLIRPKLLIPVGRLAIDRFLGALPLHEVIGRVHSVRHDGGTAICIPLPHPSGASSWIHAPGHRQLLERALRELRSAFGELGIVSPAGRSRRIA
jgi:uracil-DNA glycosylase